MADTSIEWTDKSWNPIAAYYEGKRGWMCSKPSAGCKNCYAERMNFRLGNRLRYTPENVGKVEWRVVGLDEPGRWRKPQMVFVNSMTDLFHEAIPDEMIAQVWNAMLCNQRHTYQVLTKRAERMRELVTHFLAEGEWKGLCKPDNIWLGVSVENQEQADKRIGPLLSIPAAVRFLSCEPLLGLIDLDGRSDPKRPGVQHWDYSKCKYPIDWVIAGGESGTNARPMHPDWARSLRDQCQTAGVPFLFKQWGEWEPYEQGPAPMHVDTAGRYHDGHGLHILDPQTGDVGKGWMLDDEYEVAWRKVGKRPAGRLLDGREWNEFPKSEVTA